MSNTFGTTPCSKCGEPIQRSGELLAAFIMMGTGIFHPACAPESPLKDFLPDTPTAANCVTCGNAVALDGVTCLNVLCGVVRQQQTELEALKKQIAEVGRNAQPREVLFK